jgi:hypothetical protein
MGFEHEGPEGANFRDTCAPQPVRWEDREEVRRWLRALREVVKDLRAAGRDRVRRKRKRVLSRHEAGRQLGDAWSRTERLLLAGEAGLGRAPHDPEPLPEGGPGDEPPFSSSRPTSTPPDTAS